MTGSQHTAATRLDREADPARTDASHGLSNKPLQILVCKACSRASCWLGILCDRADISGLTIRSATELRKLGLEHLSYLSPQCVRAVYGSSRPDYGPAIAMADLILRRRRARELQRELAA